MTYKPKTFKPKTCKVCGTLFTPKGPTSVFCSAECRAEAEKARDRERYARNHPNSKPGKARIHAEEDRTRREAADKRLSTKAGDSPTHYARNQVADSIEKFARIELPRTQDDQDEKETHMAQKFNSAEIIKALKERAPEVLPVPTEVKTIERLERENADLRHFNDELTAQLAQYERRSAALDDVVAILKAALRIMEA